jgi:anti-anti-sigma regulatory factor
MICGLYVRREWTNRHRVKVTTLPEHLDITAEVLVAQLRDAAGSGQLALDGTAVLRVDAAGLQLVCAAVIAVGGKVTWTNASPVLRAGAKTLGLESALGLSPASAI